MAQSLEGLSKGIPLKEQYIFKDERGYGYDVYGKADYKRAYEDTKKIFAELRGILLNNSNVAKEMCDLIDYNLHYSAYEDALKHLNGAKETKEILEECVEKTGLHLGQFMQKALDGAYLKHIKQKSWEPTKDKKVNAAVELFINRSLEKPVLSENIRYGLSNQAGDYFKTMADIEQGINSAEESVCFYKSKMPKDFSDYSEEELTKVKATWDVYKDFEKAMKEIKMKPCYIEQQKENLRLLAKERVGVEDGKGDKLAVRAENNRKKTERSKVIDTKRLLDERLGR